ncbi:hypothetical protein [Archangium sp. Cb G35]|uniref:hypothetical protein n=1 Tax=Archangium sp. Cb G35 TaxID=1920190 RepID=UPI0009F814C3|nr:hypothetical protein [Archangium sp. Cb G35]
MTIGEIISFEAPRIIGRYRTEQTSPEESELLLVARDALLFISELGQDYRFEDYRRSLGASLPPSEGKTSIETLLSEAAGLMVRIRGELHLPEEKELASVIIDALHFIASTGQHTAFEAFRRDALAPRPPHVFASFRTREEAEAWLYHQPEPPAQGQVLVAGEYYQFYYFRELNRRGLLPQFTVEMLIRLLMEEGPPATVASFVSHDEAEDWLAKQLAPPTHAFISIGGEYHLAVFHENLHHRAIHPVSIVERLEKWEREQRP